MATQHLRLNKGTDGYYRAQWVDDLGQRHTRSFGNQRNKAQNRFNAFHLRWKRDPVIRSPGKGGPVTIKRGWSLFKAWADAYYLRPDGTPTGEARNLADAFALVTEMFEETLAADFGPMRLTEIQTEMVRRKLCRNVINQRVRKIRQVFKWLVARELVPSDVWHALQSVQALAPGRAIEIDGAAVKPEESNPVTPVPEEWIRQTCDHLPASVVAMIDFQYWTGCRPQDVCNLCPAQVERDGKVWLYRPPAHKTAHKNKSRVVLIGPKAQDVLRPYLLAQTNLAAAVFHPGLAFKERLDARVAAYQPGNRGDYRKSVSYQRRQAERDFERFGDRWTPNAYANAIRRVCRDFEIPQWSPNRLRHNAGTRIRKGFGLDVAQVVLGHSSVDVTQVYAEADLSKAIQVMEMVG